MGHEKLTIKGFTDENLTGGSVLFTAQINPERFSHSKSIAYNEQKGTETAGSALTPVVPDPEIVSFDLYFDSTGAINNEDVESNIKSLRNVAYSYNGEIHTANYLRIQYGSFTFECKLTKMDVNYTLFDMAGNPIRAKVSLSFKQYTTPEKIEAEANKSSPDLTHIKLVRIGDMLPLMCNDVYGSSDYYLQVAEANGLTNFRHLEIGSSLFFPPIKK